MSAGTTNRGRLARGRFFLRLAQAKRIDERFDRETLPLFPLLLIMDADESLSKKAQILAQKVAA